MVARTWWRLCTPTSPGKARERAGARAGGRTAGAAPRAHLLVRAIPPLDQGQEQAGAGQEGQQGDAKGAGQAAAADGEGEAQQAAGERQVGGEALGDHASHGGTACVESGHQARRREARTFREGGRACAAAPGAAAACWQEPARAFAHRSRNGLHACAAPGLPLWRLAQLTQTRARERLGPKRGRSGRGRRPPAAGRSLGAGRGGARGESRGRAGHKQAARFDKDRPMPHLLQLLPPPCDLVSCTPGAPHLVFQAAGAVAAHAPMVEQQHLHALAGKVSGFALKVAAGGEGTPEKAGRGGWAGAWGAQPVAGRRLALVEGGHAAGCGLVQGTWRGTAGAGSMGPGQAAGCQGAHHSTSRRAAGLPPGGQKSSQFRVVVGSMASRPLRSGDA